MFRFTIRDVLWLTALVACLAAWWIGKRQADSRIAVIVSHAESLQAALKAARDNEMLRGVGSSSQQSVSPNLGRQYVGPVGPEVDWALADKPIPR
jgi:hypothetical protein